MTQRNDILTESLLQLARIALTGREQDIQLVIHRITKKVKAVDPTISDALTQLLQEAPTRSTPLRRHADVPLPVDVDSRLHLLRVENTELDHELVLSDELRISIDQVISERRNTRALAAHGLQPTKSLLLVGPPGVGKTMAAKWLAKQLGKPLLVLDLAAVMSSYLGRTGNNIRFVLDYAKKADCVLLLDELDAIAKRRDDSSEIGELKRLVTVLLQEIDDWPSTGILIAATNHPDLLDPAVWRRFERVLNFPRPAQQQIATFINTLLAGRTVTSDHWSQILPVLFEGNSFSEIERQIQNIRRASAVTERPLDAVLGELLNAVKHLPKDRKAAIAESLMNSGVSQRQVSEITGLARDTVRKLKNE
ncbi:MAG: AAA family ATPase [Sphingobacteriales bacterium]|nr:MAG: AAA family ATPase [Sphingobacteriales bacterium]